MKEIFSKLNIEEKGFSKKLIEDMIIQLKEGYLKTLTVDDKKISIEELELSHFEKHSFFNRLEGNEELLKRYIIQSIAIEDDFVGYFYILENTTSTFINNQGKIKGEYKNIVELLIDVLLISADTSYVNELLSKSTSYWNEELSKKSHNKAIKLAETGKDYAYLGDWQKAIEMNTDERYLFKVALFGYDAEENALEMLDMLLEYSKENYDVETIAEMANSMWEDGDAYFPRDEGNETDLDDVDEEVKQVWSDKLMKLAIEKATTKEDEKCINEFLEYQDMDIESFKKNRI